MSTDAFNRFQLHFRASGREYGDGFLRNDFHNMTSEELAEAKRILIERAGKGDTVCLRALEYIMPSEQFMIFAGSLLEKRDVTDNGFRARLTTALFNIRQSDELWDVIVEILSGSDPFARNWIMNHIAVEDLSESRKRQMADLMTKMILHPPEKGFLFYTAGGLLDSLGVVPRTPDYINYAARLKNPDPRERKIALIELGCLKPE